MRIITIFNNKGGVGKTTSVQNIGAALALFAGKRVLLIDLDQQANLTMGYGIAVENRDKNTASFILGATSLEETRVQYRDTTIDILPASPALRRQEVNIKNKGYPTNLRQALKQANHQYDYVIIDAPPAISIFSDIALVACDQYYVPLQAEYFSYEGLRNLAGYIHELREDIQVKAKTPNMSLALGGVFAVGFNPQAKRNFNKVIVQSVQEQLGDQLLTTYIRTNVALSEAQAQGMHIFDYERKYKRGKKAAEDYHALAEEIFKNMELWKAKQKRVLPTR